MMDAGTEVDDACPADGCADATSIDAGADAGEDSGPLSEFCTPGSTQPVCDGARMVLCSADGTELGALDCANERLCQVGVALGECAICQPGAFDCDGTELSVCAEDGAGWENEDTCATAALCNAVAGACTATTCLPTNKRCVGDRLERCNDDQSGFVFDEMCDPGLCDDVGDQCDVCTPGSTACVSGMLRTCNADGQGYTDGPCTQPADQCRQSTCPASRTSCLEGDRAVDAACTASGGRFCDGAGECVDCNRDNQCTSGHCAGSECVQCEAPAHCPGDDACNNPTCSGAGVCGLMRLSDVLCGSQQICTNGTCAAACGNGRIDALTDEECDPAATGWTSSTCDPATCLRTVYMGCEFDSDCPYPGSYCPVLPNPENPSGYVSVCAPACPGSNPGVCPTIPGIEGWQYSCAGEAAAPMCVIGCDFDSDCPSGLECIDGGGPRPICVSIVP
jgi:hypothetical protein